MKYRNLPVEDVTKLGLSCIFRVGGVEIDSVFTLNFCSGKQEHGPSKSKSENPLFRMIQFLKALRMFRQRPSLCWSSAGSAVLHCAVS